MEQIGKEHNFPVCPYTQSLEYQYFISYVGHIQLLFLPITLDFKGTWVFSVFFVKRQSKEWKKYLSVSTPYLPKVNAKCHMLLLCWRDTLQMCDSPLLLQRKTFHVS